ncbi:hypothetical protein S245_063395, partial [Arachis hypogaea]
VFNSKIDEGRKGVKCGIYGANCPGWIISMEACNGHGLYCVPLYDTLGMQFSIWKLFKQQSLWPNRKVFFVSLDLANFEMVRKFKPPLMKLLESGNIDLCFANQDEATKLQFFLKKASVLIALAMTAGTRGVVAGELELNHECNLMHWSPEDFESKLQGILINGQFPRPTIDAVTNNLKTPGDELEVNLKSWAVSSISSFQNIYFLENLIGKGGYAEVYKGRLPNHQLVAVKRLTRGTADETIGVTSYQNLESWLM